MKIALFVLFVGPIYLFLAWNTQSVIAFRYNIPLSQVVIESEPHDCDYDRSPIGNKECSFDREITSTKTGTDTLGNHFVTYDEGKTWSPINYPDQVQVGVFVTWRRREL